MPRAYDIEAAYAVLGVTSQDDFATIRAAWRGLIKKYHPDVWAGNLGDAVAKLGVINDAYDALSVVHKRTADSEGRAPLQAKSRRVPRVSEPGPALVKAQLFPLASNPYAGCFDAALNVLAGQKTARVQAFA